MDYPFGAIRLEVHHGLKRLAQTPNGNPNYGTPDLHKLCRRQVIRLQRLLPAITRANGKGRIVLESKHHSSSLPVRERLSYTPLFSVGQMDYAETRRSLGVLSPICIRSLVGSLLLVSIFWDNHGADYRG